MSASRWQRVIDCVVFAPALDNQFAIRPQVKGRSRPTLRYSVTPSLPLLYSSTSAPSKIDLESKPARSGRQRHHRCSWTSIDRWIS